MFPYTGLPASLQNSTASDAVQADTVSSMCHNLQGLNSCCLAVGWKAEAKDTGKEVACNHSTTFCEIKWGDFPSRWRRKHTCKDWISAIIWHSLLPALKPAGMFFTFFQTVFCVTAEKQYTILKLQSCTFPPAHVLTWLDYFWVRKTEEMLLYLSMSLPSSLALWFIFPHSVFLSHVSLCWGSLKTATPSVLHHWDSLGSSHVWISHLDVTLLIEARSAEGR